MYEHVNAEKGECNACDERDIHISHCILKAGQDTQPCHRKARGQQEELPSYSQSPKEVSKPVQTDPTRS